MLAYFLFFFYLVFGTILLHIIIRRKIFPFTIYHTAAIVLFQSIHGLSVWMGISALLFGRRYLELFH